MAARAKSNSFGGKSAVFKEVLMVVETFRRPGNSAPLVTPLPTQACKCSIAPLGNTVRQHYAVSKPE